MVAPNLYGDIISYVAAWKHAKHPLMVRAETLRLRSSAPSGSCRPSTQETTL
jgi:hypothetical protein